MFIKLPFDKSNVLSTLLSDEITNEMGVGE